MKPIPRGLRSAARLALCLAPCLALSSCLTARYPEPAASAPTATFGFGIGFNHGGRVSPYYSVVSTPCGESREVASFGYFDPQKENVRIASGEPLHIKARSFFHYASNPFDPAAPKAHWCESVATFTPERGHNYFVVHGERIYEQCVLSIRDRASNAPPPDLRIEDNINCPAH